MDSILIVDDERGIRDTLRAEMEDEGFVADAVATGEECLKALGKRAASKTSAAQDKQAAPATAAEQGQVVDMLAAENSKLDARLKTICRGC